VDKTIFTISGLRGIVGKNLTLELITQYSLKFAQYLNGKNIAIGRDSRNSGLALSYAASAGFFYAGYNVYDFGVCPTPAIVMMTKKYNLNGGVQITASHNPENWNGLKFISSKGRFFFTSEIAKFQALINQYASFNFYHRKQPKLVKCDIIDEYLNTIVNSKYFKNTPNRRFTVGVDSCNGAAERAAVKLVKMLGGTPVSLSKPTTGFTRAPEPKSENLKRLSSLIRKEKLDFGIAFDPDGDRFACVDELGVPLSEEYSILLALLCVLKQQRGAVVVNNSTTMAVDDICKQYKVPLYRSKTGEANVVEKMQEVKALIGGEGNGGVVYPVINNTRDALVATAFLIKLLAREKQPLSVIRKRLPQYFMVKTAIQNYRENWQKTAMKCLTTEYSVKFDYQDGIKAVGKNFWILIRKSNTEPIIRIIAESKNPDLTKKFMHEVIKVIKK
jgi:phosphomannomutase